jgi:multiple sugar transport system substrate-binding protein
MLRSEHFSVALLACLLLGCSRAPERDDGPVTITFMLWGRPNELHSLRRALSNEFERIHPDIHVRLLPVAGNLYQTKLATMLAAGMAPDVFAIHEAFLPMAARNELILPIDDLVAGDDEVDLDAFFPDIVSQCFYRGVQYKLPVSFNVVMLYYNKDAFDEAGLAYPGDTWSWEDMREAALKLTQRNERGKITRYGIDGPGSRWLHYLLFMWQNGGEAFDAHDHLVIGTPEYLDANTEALEFMRDLVCVDHVAPYLSEAEVTPANPFLSGERAMIMAGTWFNSQILTLWRELVRRNATNEMLRWGIAPLPKQKQRATLVFGGSPVIYSKCPHPEEAWQVIKFFLSDTWQRHLSLDGRNIPAKQSVAFSDWYLDQEGIPDDVNLRGIFAALPYARPQPQGPEVAEVMEKELSEVRDLLLSGALEDIRPELERLQADADSECPYCTRRR